MKLNKVTKEQLLDLYKTKRISLEGNILKVIEQEPDDTEFNKYLTDSLEKDKETRRKRLEVTKQVQEQNAALIQSQKENENLMEDLKNALSDAEQAKEAALNDLDVMQKKKQTELISTIVKVALLVILSVGVITTVLYLVAMFTGKDTQIIGSTWSNMFGILLTNAFSIVGTIMGVKYASEKKE
jgi:hypothetical protein